MPWYERSFRRNLVDMHIERDRAEYLSRFDPKAYYACLKTAHIQSPMIYLQSHTGLCNWDTASGETHPAFRGNNQIKELIDLCHGGGMDVVAYYSLIYNNWAYAAHPAWRIRYMDGRASREPGRYGLVCPNNMEYRAFITAQFHELCREYEFEGIFLDMTFWPGVCYCDACRARYRAEQGRELPTQVNWQDEQWLRFQSARERWMGEFALFATAEMKACKPGVSVEHQYSTIAQSYMRGVTQTNGIASDYAGGDLYGGHREQSFISKLYYETTNNQPFEYMTSRCEPNLKDHTTTKSLQSLQQHNYITLAHHGAFLAIDAIDPCGTMNEYFYQVLGQVFEESRAYEPYMTGCLQADVALFFSFGSKMNLLAEPAGPEAAEQTHAQLQALTGAAAALAGAHIPYTVLPGSRAERLARYKLVIVSEACFLREEELDALVSYVENGGALYASGTTDPRLAMRLLGARRMGFTKERITYIAPEPEAQACFGRMFTPQYPLAYQGHQALYEGGHGAQTLATITLPYTDPADTAHFATIHANPPGIPTRSPALLQGTAGKGRVLLSCASFERNAQQAHRDVFLALLARLSGDLSPIRTDAPGFVEFTVFNDEERRCTYLHAVNTQDLDPLVPAGAFSVEFRSPRSIASGAVLPTGMPLPLELAGDTVRFHAPGLTVFGMWRLNWA